MGRPVGGYDGADVGGSLGARDGAAVVGAGVGRGVGDELGAGVSVEGDGVGAADLRGLILSRAEIEGFKAPDYVVSRSDDPWPRPRRCRDPPT